MQIHSLSKVLGFPIVLMIVGILYYSSNVSRDHSVLIFIPIIILVAIYVFNGQIDHWWLTKHPPVLDPKLKEWLGKYFQKYTHLELSDKTTFENRLVIYLNARLFKSVGSEQRDVPEDIKCMVACHGIHMCLGLDDYLIGDMDRIFLYKHPFPSPDFPFLHSVETNIEDGVIILSLEQMVNAVIYPKDYYNIAYHAYGEAYMALNKSKQFPECFNTWEGIELVSGFSKKTIQEQTGIENVGLTQVHLTLFFSHPIEYKNQFPEYYERFCHIFKQRP